MSSFIKGRNFGELFNQMFIMSYLLGFLFSFYANDTVVMMSLMWISS